MRPRTARRAKDLALVVSALMFSAALATSGRSAVSSDGLSFPIGERLRYTISWASYLVAGEMTLAVKALGHFFDRSGVHLELRAATVGPVRTLVKALDEQWTSYVDPKTGLPYRVEHLRREGARRTDLTIALDHRRGVARLSTGRTIAISPETRDVVAFLYHLRTLPLRPGDRHRFSLLSERRRFLVHADVGARTLIETRLGRFEAIEIAVRVDAAGEKAAETPRLRIWLSADERRVPLMITAEEGLGEIRVELVEMATEATVSQEPRGGSSATLFLVERAR